eukprot:TRINITY_DN3185_c0_g1_i4.p1 TRINITY_DN3185_c0_g1~~TRINITY_DN3185_c0_g1_i4.p1  ORF type:complete len:255 (-),score=33.80 TRINITY_DN3185_c0_g1_i4:46-810(-)
MDAVQNGKADVTSNDFWLAGTQRDGSRRAEVFRATCSTVSCNTTLWTRMEDHITTRSDALELNKVFKADPSLKLGAVGVEHQMTLQVLFPNVTVDLFSTTEEAVQAFLITPAIKAVAPACFMQVPAGMYEVDMWLIQPYTMFFRKDIVSCCTDNEVDETLDEECLSTGIGCTSECTCRPGYHQHHPAQTDCEKDTEIKTTTIVLSVVLGTFGVVLLATLVCVIVAVGVMFPLMRKKYRQEGATKFRSRMFGHRW